MSLRQVFRSKLKSFESKSDKEDKTSDASSSSKAAINEESTDAGTDASTQSSSDQGPGTGIDQNETEFKDCQEDDKRIYEVQLTQLQEQLVAAMIENQNLGAELKMFKEENQIDTLLQDLEFERQRNQQMASELQAVSKSPKGAAKKESGPTDKDADRDEWVDIAQEATEELEHCLTPEERDEAHQTLRAWFVRTFYDFVADFTDDPEPEDQKDPDGEQLAVKKLKDNMKRFKQGTKPIYNTTKGVQAMFRWKNPALTLIVFLIYMYSVWHGWLLPVTLFLALFRLFINYLQYRGWNINIRYLSEVESDHSEPEDKKESSMSDKFNLVLQVARQVQNQLGRIADSLEKIKNLLTWKQPDATFRLFLFLLAAFIMSCVLAGPTFFLLVGLWMGFKMFILEYIYSRFPRFQQRHDSVHQMWKDLPTDSDLLKRYQKAAIDRHVSDSGPNQIQRRPSAGLRADEKHFCELFSLPFTEKPRPGWEGGRRCTLIDRDKSLASGFKSGKMYLTMNYLCFERYKTSSPKNIMIALSDITKVQKAKPYSWLPGAGMSIEITIVGFEKPYLFGALLSRDECYDNIFAHGVKQDFPWAADSEAGADGGSTGSDDSNSRKQEKSKEKSPAKEPTFRMSELKDDMNNYFVDESEGDNSRDEMECCENIDQEFDFPGEKCNIDFIAN